MPTAGELIMRNSDLFRQNNASEGAFMDANLRIGMKWGSQAIAARLLARDGAVIQSGLFAGMAYHHAATEGALAARRLGTYESELRPHIERILASEPLQIIDIGCAEGLYAVGLARLTPFTMVQAFDISETAQQECRKLAAMNDVAERVVVGGEVDHALLNSLTETDAFVFCDIEGGELALLDPDAVPNLKRCALIVETHPMAAPGVTEAMTARFQKTHRITLVKELNKPPPPGHWLEDAPTADQFFATWEWRYRPTPWLVMEPR